MVVAWHGSAGLHAYDLEGRPLWSRDLGVIRHIWGWAGSPMIHGDGVYLNCGPGERTFVVAIDKRTGEPLWQTEEPGGAEDKSPKTGSWLGSWSTPVVAKVDGQEQLLVNFPGHVNAYDLKTGKILWTSDGNGDLAYTDVMIDPEQHRDRDGRLHGAAIGFKLTGGSGNITASARLWRMTRRTPSASAPASSSAGTSTCRTSRTSRATTSRPARRSGGTPSPASSSGARSSRWATAVRDQQGRRDGRLRRRPEGVPPAGDATTSPRRATRRRPCRTARSSSARRGMCGALRRSSGDRHSTSKTTHRVETQSRVCPRRAGCAGHSRGRQPVAFHVAATGTFLLPNSRPSAKPETARYPICTPAESPCEGIANPLSPREVLMWQHGLAAAELGVLARRPVSGWRCGSIVACAQEPPRTRTAVRRLPRRGRYARLTPWPRPRRPGTSPATRPEQKKNDARPLRRVRRGQGPASRPGRFEDQPEKGRDHRLRLLPRPARTPSGRCRPFEEIMKEDIAAKPKVMAAQRKLLESRYDLDAEARPRRRRCRAASRSPSGPTARLAEGMTWDKLASMTPEADHARRTPSPTRRCRTPSRRPAGRSSRRCRSRCSPGWSGSTSSSTCPRRSCPSSRRPSSSRTAPSWATSRAARSSRSTTSTGCSRTSSRRCSSTACGCC